MNKVSVLAIDLAKTSFQLHGNDERGKCVEKKTLKRPQLEAFIANTPPCTIAMEACGSSNYWAWRFAEHGHTVRLIAPQYVKPYVKGNKNDKADAAAIAEAATRPSMRFVPVKPAALLDLQMIHRVRERLVGQKTALVNETRAILFEQGITLAQGISTLKAFATGLLRGETKETVTPMCKETVADLIAELGDLEERIAVSDRRLERFAAESDACKRLQTIPGIGVITATALVAAIPDPRAFQNGRQFAAWLGLVPRHSGTGGADKNKIGGISKRGDAYLRRLLVSGAHSVLRTVDRRTDQGAVWIRDLKERKAWCRTAVALANKNARIIWSLLVTGETFNAAKMVDRKAG